MCYVRISVLRLWLILWPFHVHLKRMCIHQLLSVVFHKYQVRVIQIFYVLIDFWGSAFINYWEKMLKFLAMIVEFSIFLFNSFPFCFIRFEALLLRACVFVIIMSSWWNDIFIIIRYPSWSLALLLNSISLCLVSVILPPFLCSLYVECAFLETVWTWSYFFIRSVFAFWHMDILYTVNATIDTARFESTILLMVCLNSLFLCSSFYALL